MAAAVFLFLYLLLCTIMGKKIPDAASLDLYISIYICCLHIHIQLPRLLPTNLKKDCNQDSKNPLLCVWICFCPFALTKKCDAVI